LCDPMLFGRFSGTPTCDRRTNDSIYRANIGYRRAVIKTTRPKFIKFLRMLPTAVARSSFIGVAIYYALPVLLTMSSFHIMAPYGVICIPTRRISRDSNQILRQRPAGTHRQSAPAAKSAVYDWLVFILGLFCDLPSDSQQVLKLI